MKFLFVDEENAYEGPIAEALAFEVFNGSGRFVTAKSRGISVPEGKRKSNFTRYLLDTVELSLEEEELDSLPLTQADIDEADVVMTMTNEQKYRLSQVCPADKLFTFLEYTTGGSEDVISPKGSDMRSYKACLFGMNEAFETLLHKWQAEKGNE